MSAWAGAAGAVLLSLAAGHGLRRLLVPRALGRAEALAWAWLLGAVLTALVMLALLAVGLPLRAGWIALPLAACALLGLADLRRSTRAPARDRDSLRDRAPARGRARAALGLALLLAVALVSTHALRQGARFADAHAVWALRAKVLAVDGSLDGSYWRDWHDAHDRRAYPPLVSLLGAWARLAAGDADARAGKLPLLACWLALLALVHARLAERLTPAAALGGTLVLALARPPVLAAGWGVADLPLALWLLAAAGEAARGRRASPLLLGAALTALALTKYEGAWMVGAVALAGFGLGASPWGAARAPASGAGTGARTARVRLAQLAAWLAPALALGVWLALMVGRDVPLETGPAAAWPTDLVAFARRTSTALHALAGELVAPSWCLLAPLAALGAVCTRGAAPRADRLERIGTRLVLLLLALAVATYGFQRMDTGALLATTLERLLLQVFPLAFVVVVGRVLPRLTGVSSQHLVRVGGRA